MYLLYTVQVYREQIYYEIGRGGATVTVSADGRGGTIEPK
jgi:hypothetical protein